MVTKPNTPMPAGPTGLQKAPTKIEPPKPVSGFSGYRSPTPDDVANKDRSKDISFKLPEKVTQDEIKENSFKYGGGRSAGNRSILENAARKVDEQ